MMISPEAKGAPGATADAPGTVENIQALRGIAALLVVGAHMNFALGVLCPQARIPSFIQFGYGTCGVDIFFIISGYVISLTACKRHGRSLDFLLARVARVSPLYLAIFFPAVLQRAVVSGHHISFRSVWNGLFYLPVFDWVGYTTPPLEVGWTLSFEMWFYLAFALLLLVWNAGRVVFYLPIVLSIGAGLMTFYHGAWYFPRFLFHPFVLEFALGCIIFHTQKHVRGRMPWLLLAGAIFYLLAFSRDSEGLGSPWALLSFRMDLAWLRVLLWGIPAALLVAGAVGLERCHGYILPRILVWLGGISYSLYLTHWFALLIIAKVGPWIGLHNPILVALVVPIFAVFLAWLCWKWVEQPLTSRAQRWAKWMARPTKPVDGGPIAAEPVANV